MDKLICVGALARLEPDPRDELAVWEADLPAGRIDSPAETRMRLDAHARGEQVIVTLELFAEVGVGEDIRRHPGPKVRGAWFDAHAVYRNEEHAREMARGHLDALYRTLTHERGLDLEYGCVVDADITVELDAALAERLDHARATSMV